MSRQIDQEIIQATDELKKDVALTTEIITGNEHTVVEVAPGNTVRSPKKMIEDCYRETQQAIEEKFGSLDQAVNDATAAADRADSASQSASDSAGDSATSATTASQKAQEADASATKAASNEQAAGNSATQSATSAANAKASETAAGQSAVNAADSATAAATSATTATTESEQAGQSAATATQQATRAQAWAANPVGDMVEDEQYSSLHYARQSSDSAANSSASANRAEASATQAKTSETASASSASLAQNSATSAGSSASDALNSANNAKASETATQQSASTAQTAEQNAQASASQAGVSETTAAGSATTATQQADRSESEADRSEAAAASLKAISNPNLLINADMSVWQRGTNLAGYQGFGADRWWLAHRKEGCSVNLDNNPQSVPSGVGSMMRLNVPDTPGDGSAFGQAIELPYPGTSLFDTDERVTVSFEYNAEFKENIGVSLKYRDNKFSATNEIYLIPETDPTVYSSAVIRKFVVTFKAVRAKPTNTVLLLEIGNITGWMNITKVKIEKGSVATSFIADDPATNLAKCQRYFQNNFRALIYSSNTGEYFAGSLTQIFFQESLRTIPTVTYSRTGGIDSPFFVDADQNGICFWFTTPQEISSYADLKVTADAEL